MDEEKIEILLDSPISIKLDSGAECKIDVIKLGKFRGRHLELLSDDFFETEVLKPKELLGLIAGLGNIPLDAVREIEISDLFKCAEKLKDVMGKNLLKTGGT